METDKFNFEKLDVYQQSVQFVTHIYQSTKKYPQDEMYGLARHIRRTAISIVSNICEGSSRGQKEFQRFLDIARGSVFECVGQAQIARQLEYISKEQHQEIYQWCIKLSKMIMGLRKSI